MWTIRTLVGERCPAAAYTENLGNAQYPPCQSRKFVQIFVERDENRKARLARFWHNGVRAMFTLEAPMEQALKEIIIEAIRSIGLDAFKRIAMIDKAIQESGE